MHPADFYEPLENNFVRCTLCRRYCKIAPGRKGYCSVRKNIDGKLYALAYGKAVAWAVDPIEKKPFYHFKPSSLVFSFATVGCNFRCLYCQNWDISQQRTRIIGEQLLPEQIIEKAISYGAKGIAYTYNEPTIFMEYALDTARLGKKNGLFSVFVTNGYMSREAIKKMEPIDAARIDLKAFDQKKYDWLAGGVELEGVLDSIKLLHKKMHIEIISLLIPGFNDQEDEIRAMAQWIKDLDRHIPLHFTAFHPDYKMTNYPPTPLNTLIKARNIALEEGLSYVYTGNIWHPETESTYCPYCGNLLIKRYGFEIENKLGKTPRCPYCGKHLPNLIL